MVVLDGDGGVMGGFLEEKKDGNGGKPGFQSPARELEKRWVFRGCRWAMGWIWSVETRPPRLVARIPPFQPLWRLELLETYLSVRGSFERQHRHVFVTEAALIFFCPSHL